MPTVNLLLEATPFDINPSWTLEQFHQAVAASLSTATSSDSVLLGYIGGSNPGSGGVGPWLKDEATWWVKDGSEYVPQTLQVGNATHQVTLISSPTANRSLTFPDKDGILATLDDVTDGRGTTSLKGATPEIDWSLTNSFALSMTIDATLSHTNSLPGQQIRFAVYNPVADYALTFPDSIHFSGGASSPAPETTTVYVMDNIAGQIYARAITGYFYGLS